MGRKHFLKKTWTLIKPYWSSEDKWVAWALLTGIISLVLGYVFMIRELNYWQNDFYNALQDLDAKAFGPLILQFFTLAIIAILAFMMQFYMMQLLELRWRQWMTRRFTESWLSDQAYYRLQLTQKETDNPDQRISEDINNFSRQTFGLFLGVFRETITLFTFLGVLWGLSGTLEFELGGYAFAIPGYMCWGAILYASVGSVISYKVGYPLIRLDYEQEHREADFRFSMMRLRENVEGVAFLGGEKVEQSIFDRSFSHVVTNYKSIIHRMMGVNCWTSAYGQAAAIFPMLLAAPRLFAKEIQFGGLMQTLNAFSYVHSSLSFFVEQFPQIASWKATTQRLIDFQDNLEKTKSVRSKITVIPSGSPNLSLKNTDIFLPNGSLLLSQMDLEIQPKTRLLLTGPSGIGKSTFLRTLAGLWPYATGTLEIPENYHALFIPQKPYMPLGTLANCITYPQPTTSHSETEIVSTLERVGLSKLVDKLNHTEDWSRVLSLGEQQRIGMARALMSQPTYLFMDECTSALDEQSEAHFFEILTKDLPNTVFVSVGHRASIKSFHNQFIDVSEYSENMTLERA